MFKSKTLINKIVLSALSFLVLFFSLALPVKAADTQPTQETSGTWYDQNFYEWYSKVYDENYSTPSEIFGERYTAAQVQWVIYSVPSVFLNMITGGTHGVGVCLTRVIWGGAFDIPTCVQSFSTAFGKFGDMIKNYQIKTGLDTPNQANSNNLLRAIFSDRPLSGITYFKEVGRKFHIVPRAEAAETGFGFGALGPVNQLWKVSRNFAYAIFTLVIIVFAFMIMFRIKLNPQTVITIQSALPKVVIAMILVTFSYAIAGFMVDLMYVVIGFFSAILASSSSALDLLNQSPIYYYNWLSGRVSLTGGFTPDNLLEGPVLLILYFVGYLFLYLVAVIFALAASLLNLSVSNSLVGLILLVFVIALVLILIFNIFRIFWMLFKTLANIYMTVILGPIQIALGTVVPGMGFGSWLKKLIANLAVFPAFGVLFFLSFLFLTYSIKMSIKVGIENDVLVEAGRLVGEFIGIFFGGVSLDPNVITSGFAWNAPWIGGQASLAIAFIFMSLGCIMAIPSVAKAIETFMAGKAFDMESAIGEIGGMAMTGATAFSKGAQVYEALKRHDIIKTRPATPAATEGLQEAGKKAVNTTGQVSAQQ